MFCLINSKLPPFFIGNTETLEKLKVVVYILCTHHQGLFSVIVDGSLELCRFTNHSESQRVSCCSHDTERELLKAAELEYSSMLANKTDEVEAQLTPGAGLKRE